MPLKSTQKQSVVLLVEDSPDDEIFCRLAIETAGLAWRLFAVRDGEDAVQYLSGQGLYSDRAQYPVPNLVLLDLNMPRLDGFGLLAWIQEHSELNDTATVVLSSSNFDLDVARAKSLGVDEYLVKPNRPQELIQILQKLNAHWLGGGLAANN